MKKMLVSMLAVAALAGCTYYDYYKGGIRYTQDGDDCVYYADEYARHFSENISGLDNDKRIVYRNTRCEDLFARDNAARLNRNERKALVPVAAEPAPVAASGCCGCKAEPVSRRFYTITSK
jgi:hypothetical protein